MRHARFVLVSLVLTAACAAPRPAEPPPPACGRTPDEVLGCARQREEAVHSLRARFSATTQRQGETHDTNGVLLVAKPDRFRLRLMLPLGLTVFDYTKDGARVQMSLPLQGGDAKPGAPAPFAEIDLAEAFLRGDYAFPGTCSAAADGETAVLAHCAREGGVQRDLRLDTAAATILEETSWDGERARLVLRYADYRPTSGTLLPYRISLAYPERNTVTEIEIQRYEVNPELAPDLFRPSEP